MQSWRWVGNLRKYQSKNWLGSNSQKNWQLPVSSFLTYSVVLGEVGSDSDDEFSFHNDDEEEDATESRGEEKDEEDEDEDEDASERVIESSETYLEFSSENSSFSEDFDGNARFCVVRVSYTPTHSHILSVSAVGFRWEQAASRGHICTPLLPFPPFSVFVLSLTLLRCSSFFFSPFPTFSFTFWSFCSVCFGSMRVERTRRPFCFAILGVFMHWLLVVMLTLLLDSKIKVTLWV